MESGNDQTSILVGINIRDVASIKRVMSVLRARLADISEEKARQLYRLTAAEGVVVERLVAEAQRSPLLRRMLDRFTAASLEVDSVVLKATEDLVRLSIEAVRNPGSRPEREMILVQEAFHLLVQGNDLDFGPLPGGAKRVRGSSGADMPTKRAKKAPRKGKPTTPRVINASEQGDIMITRNSTTPVRKPGDRGIDDGSLDRDIAKLGEEDRTKFVIIIPCERKNKQTGIYEPTDPAYFPYRHIDNFDWNDKSCIKALNSWRNQVFVRCLGKKGDTRQSWAAKELEELLAIMSDHLKSPAVRGSWGLIDWEAVATRFNQGLATRTFHPSDLTAEVQYSTQKPRKSTAASKKAKGDGTGDDAEDVEAETQAKKDFAAQGMNTVISKPRPLGEGRVPVARTATGIKTTLLRFTDPRAVKMVTDSQAIGRMGGMRSSQIAGDENNADDDEERNSVAPTQSPGFGGIAATSILETDRPARVAISGEGNAEMQDETPVQRHRFGPPGGIVIEDAEEHIDEEAQASILRVLGMDDEKEVKKEK